MRKLYLAIIVVLFSISYLYAQPFTLVKDINPGSAGSVTSAPWEYISKNGILYFTPSDGTHGYELWRSDGTAAGTFLLKDCFPGTSNGDPGPFLSVNDQIYFFANIATGRRALWKTDGTIAGTVMVKDLPATTSTLANVNNTVFFVSSSTGNGIELWKTDGTDAGTVMVKDINPGSNNSDPRDFVTLNGVLYFTAVTNSSGRELWKSDGTSAGTVMVKEFVAGPTDADPQSLIKVNNNLVFSATNGASLKRLWKSDGTSAGTVMIKDITTDLTVSNYVYKVLNGALYFSADDGTNGRELWKSDGTAAGTVMVKDVNPGAAGSNITMITSVNGMVLFNGDDGSHGRELWRSDGTGAGTVLVKDILAGASSGYPTSFFHIVNNKLAFIANDGVNGSEAWTSDGSTDGTRMVQDFANSASAAPPRLATAGSQLFLSFDDATVGRELWVTTISSGAPLPLTLLDIRAQLTGNDGLLNWKTAFEENTSGFEIERSTDNRHYAAIGLKPSANATGIHEYTFTDAGIVSLGAPVIYYRLKMKDVDGKSTYSKIIAININSKEPVVMLYPNPVRTSLSLMISVQKKEKLSYSIIDAQGRIVSSKNITVNEGSNNIPVETGTLNAGVYTIRLAGTFTNGQLMFVKQ